MGTDSAEYRLRLARGFLGEADQDIGLGRWRSAMDNLQPAYTLSGAVTRTDPA